MAPTPQSAGTRESCKEIHAKLICVEYTRTSVKVEVQFLMYVSPNSTVSMRMAAARSSQPATHLPVNSGQLQVSQSSRLVRQRASHGRYLPEARRGLGEGLFL